MDSEKLLQLPSELLLLWHAHRTEILLSAGILFACLRLAIHYRKSRSKEVLSPPLSPLEDEKKATGLLVEQPTQLPQARQNAVVETISRPKLGPKRVTGVKKVKRLPPRSDVSTPTEYIQPHIFYFSLSGSTLSYANTLLSQSGKHGLLEPILHDLSSIDYDDYFLNYPKAPPPNTIPFYLLLLPTYDIPTDLDNFIEHLDETHHDFRVDSHPLSSIAGYSAFGLGDQSEWRTEEEGFCRQAVEVDKWMAKLTGGKRAFPLGVGDVRSDAEEKLKEWAAGVTEVCKGILSGKGLGEGVPGSGEAVESEDEEVEDGETTLTSTARRKVKKRSKASATDLEDLRAPVPVDFTTTTTTSLSKPSQPPKAMVPADSPTYANLTKQGYTIVGTHSGVKICRWTKSALRGRGSCYKYSFYGIASHLCMEATPSLSCSNKCVFCWRHGTNPVSTTWKWQVDEPEMIFNGMKEGHYRKIKMMKGVPGVRAERFSDAMKIRHCALSLVGEPIFYPHINKLLDMLHKEHISTFLVCNAQHPDQLAALNHVTQLYVSIDASNKESLKRIDRPLHRDYWERFLRCMDIIRARRFEQRTVFRLTLVKDFNISDEIEGYADLVERALPAFVEIKGVTYCGTSTAAGAGLSMRNVPFYEEVTAFVLALEAALKRRGLKYGIGAEHAHSCCVLLADEERFFISPKQVSSGEGFPHDSETSERQWHTRIHFAGFFECLKRKEEEGVDFGPEDYIGDPTPEWALWGRGGFDPRDERVDRKGRKIDDVKE